jgi:WhiB family redox-sensing transcriptional regulator
MFDAASIQSVASRLLAPGVEKPCADAVNVDELPCRLVDPEVFFAEQPADVEYAKSLCLDCPVQEACLTGALERREPWGVWGGQLVIAGEVVARKRPRGRPRKHPLPDSEPVAPAAQQRPLQRPVQPGQRGPIGRTKPGVPQRRVAGDRRRPTRAGTERAA